jgi:hypothetical protein
MRMPGFSGASALPFKTYGTAPRFKNTGTTFFVGYCRRTCNDWFIECGRACGDYQTHPDCYQDCNDNWSDCFDGCEWLGQLMNPD